MELLRACFAPMYDLSVGIIEVFVPKISLSCMLNKDCSYSFSFQVIDKHLSLLAKQHMETRFVKIHAEKSPFLADKLKIVVLPTLALVKHAKVEDYVVCPTMEIMFRYPLCLMLLS